MSHPLNIAFIHPDLGIGGAERLVIDAAVHLRASGHRVVIFTSHHDRKHCFEETRDGTLDVRVYGDFLPLHVAQRLRVPCAIVRACYLASRLAGDRDDFDVIFCDLVSGPIPLLHVFTRAKIIFYCHFPDRLLAPRRNGLYRWYRAPIDWLEETTTKTADRVLVNSRFTASVFRNTFARPPVLTPEVVYPGVDPDRYDPAWECERRDGRTTILSLNRYERKKNVGLAIEAFAALRSLTPAEAFGMVRLVIAGGYDERLRECRETLDDLRKRARELDVGAQVDFLRSPTETERIALLSGCRCVVYTAEYEHFGYVPVEAMAAGRPVIAVNNGGPAETIVDGATGFLCAPTARDFGAALARLIEDPQSAERMGLAGRDHVMRHFSRTAFGTRLERVIQETVTSTPSREQRA